MQQQYYTCVNHDDLAWLSKDLNTRSTFYMSQFLRRECPCPASDLRPMTTEEIEVYLSKKDEYEQSLLRQR